MVGAGAPPFRVESPSTPGGPHYLKYLRKTTMRSGEDVLHEAERRVSESMGGSELQLQDASFIMCSESQAAYDLGFRYLLVHGQTWYEARGYRVVGSAAKAMRARVHRAVIEYAHTPVDAVTRGIREQLARLAHPEAKWTFVDTSLHNSSASMSTFEPSQPKHTIIRARRRLLALMNSAPPKALLGPWLSTLLCTEYAFFMEAMYGDRYGARPRWAIAEAGGVRTPTLALFKRANALKRYTGRIVWGKRLAQLGPTGNSARI